MAGIGAYPGQTPKNMTDCMNDLSKYGFRSGY